MRAFGCSQSTSSFKTMHVCVDLQILRETIRQDCSFCAGGRLQRASNQWLRQANEACCFERLPHEKYVINVVRLLTKKWMLCFLASTV